ncbi:MAG: hypothetical protein CVU05_11580 [Bacteroidetes bacterium HGW-Bacteroidetes-21]|jgi:acyl-[acyl-carrier-protein]-phospholipid O-acyltransferase/long-chain-fatty-acid--[acyl-carrier-protein] ligase|nr:MAG: hypothetical protein CVU05_11580 [Bacteroidetes bacterium HGW-Bacteroidetes-21]
MRWIPLFATNFLGVFNNNFIKNLICFVAVGWVSGKGEDNSFIVTLASGLYVVSYVLFSPLGGRLAKWYSKKRIMVLAKLAEIPVFIFSITGFYFQNLTMVMTGIFILGLISTLFSPSKYGLIRDIDGEKGISYGTGTLEMLTFFGVLLGTLAASLISDHFDIILLSGISVFSSLLALFSIYKLKVAEEPEDKTEKETLNPVLFFIKSYKWASAMQGTNAVIAGLATFWMIGNLIQMNLMVHCPNTLHMTNTETGIVMTFAAIGIGLGSYITGILSRGRIAVRLTPIGGIGMIVSLLLLYFLQPTGWFFTGFVFIAAFFCGVYMVPLSAYIQNQIKGRKQGDIIAYSNFTSFLFILISSGLFGFVSMTIDTNTVFLMLVIIVALMTLLMTVQVPTMRIFRKKMNNSAPK